MNKTVRIGTRESRLAVIQAGLVAKAIQKHHPDIETRLVTMKTTGDKVLDRTLDSVGGKGLFVKELDEALRRGDVDICVHSYKDMPADIDAELPVVAVSPREDPRDVLILPPGAQRPNPALPIGCSSRRRSLQIERLYPGHAVAPVRGNVLTRLNKLDGGQYAALVLAAAGIVRLGLQERVSRLFSVDELLPAGCQGVLAIQGRRGEDHTYLSEYHCPGAWDTSLAERAFIKRLGGGCGAPVGAYGELCAGTLRLRGMAAGEDGRLRFGEISGRRENACVLGATLAENIMGGAAL